jgi:hypothetical protein
MTRTVIGWVTAAVVGLCAAVGGGCSGFNAAYETALAQGAAPAGSIEGAWDGTWTSQAGHGGGRLRAVITRAGPDTYHAWFRAGFWNVMEASQEVDLKVVGGAAGSEITAAGEEDLGWLYGGVYRYEATVTPVKFGATYSSKYDRGVFEMVRPAGGGK